MFIDWIALYQSAHRRHGTTIGSGVYAPPILDEWVRSVLFGRDTSVPPASKSSGRWHSPRASTPHSPEMRRRAVEMRPMTRRCDVRNRGHHRTRRVGVDDATPRPPAVKASWYVDL